MGLRTAEQYKSSLRDGRAVFFRGEKVNDVTTHPVIGIAVEHACIDYRMGEEAKYRELAVVKDGAGEYSRYFHLPRNGEDLRKRSELIAASTRDPQIRSGFRSTSSRWSRSICTVIRSPYLPASAVVRR